MATIEEIRERFFAGVASAVHGNFDGYHAAVMAVFDGAQAAIDTERSRREQAEAEVERLRSALAVVSSSAGRAAISCGRFS